MPSPPKKPPRNDKFDTGQLDPKIIRGLELMGIRVRDLVQADKTGAPYTHAGIMGLMEAKAPQLVGKNITGLALPTNQKTPQAAGSLAMYAPESAEYSRGAKDVFFTRAHEAEHALAYQGLGGTDPGKKFDELVGDPKARGEIQRGLVENWPWFVGEWGMSSGQGLDGYFSKEMGRNPRVFHEQLANMSALEQAKGKRMVDDPLVREKILNTPAKREAYDAMTGLRQTRLDARDLPPYTRQSEDKAKPKEEEEDSGVLQRLLKALKGSF